MLVSKTVEVELNPNNIKRYENLGYTIPRRLDKHGRLTYPRGTKIIIRIEDLLFSSNIIIICKCDYCGEEFPRRYVDYINTHNKEYNNGNDACKNCVHLKTFEVFEMKYGVENISQLEWVKDKIKDNNLLKYGVENVSQCLEIQEKKMESYYRNGTTATSNQQRYIHNLIGGQLNYPYYSAMLDIAFPNEKIYCECDFGGHWLQVKFGNITEEDFIKKERNRWYSLFRSGWKEIRIISKTDKVPSDEVVLEIIRFAKEYLNSCHSWIRFNIDESKIKCSQYEIDYDFGELRRIKKEMVS